MLEMCKEAMAEDRILAKLVIILTSLLKAPKEMVVPEASLINDLGADFLSLIKLVMEVEDEFDINISCDAAEKIKTVDDLVDAIIQAMKLQEKNSGIVGLQTAGNGMNFLTAISGGLARSQMTDYPW